MTILITGINGFVGKHLAREAVAQGHSVIGVGVNGGLDESLAGIVSRYELCDLTDALAVAKLNLEGVQAIINLAGLAKVGSSFGQAELYKRVNVDVLAVLGRRLLAEKSKVRLIAISSSMVYDSAQPMPLSEASRTSGAGSPYADSKLLMEAAAAELKSQGLDCVVMRPFNHIGPGQESGFLVPDLYQQIEGVIKRSQPLLVVNLSSKRDYTDVRDVAKAYLSIAAKPTLAHNVYNVCSGHSVSGTEILANLLAQMGLKETIKPQVDQAKMRPSDVAELYGSAERLRAETGWQPTIPIAQSLKDFILEKTT